MNTPLTDVIKRLKETRERDRKNAAETFAAAASLFGIADSAISTATNLIEEFTPERELKAGENDLDIHHLLNQKWHDLRSETDRLLIECVSDEDIRRVLLREEILDRIQARITVLFAAKSTYKEEPVDSKDKPESVILASLDKLSKSELIEIAKGLNLKGYSRLKKSELINLISSKSRNEKKQ